MPTLRTSKVRRVNTDLVRAIDAVFCSLTKQICLLLSRGKSVCVLPYIASLTQLARCQWADYLDSQGIRFAFFSAANSAAIQQLRREEHEAALAAAERGDDAESGPEDESDEEDSESEEEDEDADEAPSSDEDSDSDKSFFSIDEEPDPALQDPRARVLSVLELEDLFMRMAPPLTGTR